MSDLKKGDEESGHPRIRITLTSRNKDEVEKGASLPLSSFPTRFTRHARSHMPSSFFRHHLHPILAASASLIAAGKKQSLAIKGPVRMPTKHLKLTVRKSPCGNVRASLLPI